MSSAASHWGTLINPDKSPAPLLEQLCLGIAQLMPSFDSNGTTDLTPERLAVFYRKVGGNYDPLFLETKTQALSFIYQSLGCFHSLQPTTNPYEAPSIPSLLPNGFVRWQTIQLLMDPDEHWRFLSNAVSQWDIVDAKGEIFPKEIPRDAFPSEPDPEMLQWHEGVSRRLEYDYVKRNVPRMSPSNFGAYHHQFNGQPSPGEEDYMHHVHGSGPRHHHHSHYDTDRPSRRRHHHRRLSDENPPPRSRRHDQGFVPRPDGGRSGMASPRSSSPPGFPERPRWPRGRDQSTWYGHPHNPEMDAAEAPNISDHAPRDDDIESKSKRRSHYDNLSPPPHSRTRRHSHDAYTRKPARDLSPEPTPHRNGTHESRSSKSNKLREKEKSRRRDDRSRSRPAGVKFRDFIFDGPIPAPGPDPPAYATPQAPPPPPPPRSIPRHRFDFNPDDSRRGSYSSSTGGSRPGSGGSGERPRSYSSAGFYPHPSRWSSPVRSTAAKRYIPTSVAEDTAYTPSPRRAPIYD